MVWYVDGMTTTGTRGFNPTLGNLVLYAFQLCGLRPTELAQEHMTAANMAANLVAATMSGDSLNLWEVTKVSVPLVAGQAVYSYDPAVITVLDAYISVPNGDGTYTDRIMMPIGRSEYANYPDKTVQSQVPTVFWADKLLSPTITLWQVPNDSTCILQYYCVQQIQDMSLNGGATTDLPVYFLEAFAVMLATRLAMMFAPEKAVALEAFAEKLYDKAKTQNTENSNFYLAPNMSGFFRI